MKLGSYDLDSWINWEHLSGLKPRAWILLASEIPKEEFKNQVLSRIPGLLSRTVSSLYDVVQLIEPDKKELNLTQRMEVIEDLLRNPEVIRHLPLMAKMNRRRNYIWILDQSLQRSRLCYRNLEECQVLHQRLVERGMRQSKYTEYELFSEIYENYLKQMGWTDPPLRIKNAIERIERLERAENLPAELPGMFYWIPIGVLEPVQRLFLDRLSQFCKIEEVSKNIPCGVALTTGITFKNWHTLDDAAQALADELVQGDKCEKHVVIYDGQRAVRETLGRALESRGLGFRDAREPKYYRLNEGFKAAFLPIEAVALNFQREKTISYLKQYHRETTDQKQWVKKIFDGGIESGIGSYRAVGDPELDQMLSGLQERFGGRRTLQELKINHKTWLREQIQSGFLAKGTGDDWEAFWDEVAGTDEVSLRHNSKRHIRIWLEKIRNHQNFCTRSERIKNGQGLSVYRFSEYCNRPGGYEKLIVFGMKPDWLLDSAIRDVWLGQREREILGSEFQIVSSDALNEVRLKILNLWLDSSKEVEFYGSYFDPAGKEHENIRSTVKALLPEEQSKLIDLSPEQDLGAHETWLRSYGPDHVKTARRVRIPEAVRPSVTASSLDLYSRCPYRYLAQHEWNLSDPEEPTMDLRGDVYGVLVHRVLHRCCSERERWIGKDETGLREDAEQVVRSAWRECRKTGWIASRTMEKWIINRAKDALFKFMLAERKYLERSQTRIMALEGPELEYAYQGIRVKGKPDRIDEHPDGIFVIDYKTGSNNPSGADILDQGSRVQLPVYALSAGQAFSRDCIGFQYIVMNKKADRSRGAFLSEYNGSGQGKLTKCTKANKSLLVLSKDEFKERLEKIVHAELDSYQSGRFDVLPKNPDEDCESCRIIDLCGIKR